MESFSIIVTAHNNAAVLCRTLQSAEDAVRFFQNGFPQSARAEIVVVDDGSTDATWEVILAFTKGKSLYRLIRRLESSSPSCARNTGVAHSTGSLLFFLDGDDLYYPNHIDICFRAIQAGAQFVKTKVHLADPVHADWHSRIEFCLALNVCVKRECHLAISGFPDYHLFERTGDGLRPVLDIFFKLEDQYYNQLLSRLFKGYSVAPTETVEYLRYKGNSYDRQYAKFCQPFGTAKDDRGDQEIFQIHLADLVYGNLLQRLKK